MAPRKRPAPVTVAPHSTQASSAPPPTPRSLSSSGSAEVVPPPEIVSSTTPPDVLSGLAKRLCGTPERIALENCRPCLQEEDSPLLEVPEETLAQHNLSLSLQEKGSEEQSSSSESELEEEGEELWRRGVEPQAWADGEKELDSETEQNKEEENRKHEKEAEEQECVSEGEEDEGESSDESGQELIDDPELKPLSEKKTESTSSEPLEQPPSLDLQTQHTLMVDPTHTYTTTCNPLVTPEDPTAKRSGVIEEFWQKSAEIRKSLGQSVVPETCDPDTQSSDTGDPFDTSAYITSNSNLPLHTPCECDSINQTSGTLTQSSDTNSNQTPSTADLQNEDTHFQGTSKYGSFLFPEARIVSMKEGNDLEVVERVEVVQRISLVHRLGLTLEGQVAKGIDLTTASLPSKTSGIQRFSDPELRFSLLSRSPPVARQELDLNHSDPILNKKQLLSSCTVPIRKELVERDRLKSRINSAQSLPLAEVEVLYAGEADELHSHPAMPHYASVTEAHAASMRSKNFAKDKTTPEGQRKLTDPLQVAGPKACQERSEIETLEEEEKVKKRSSLFLPRKNQKSSNLSGGTQQEMGKHKSLWKSVFSGYKKEKKRKEAEGRSRTLPNNVSQENRKRMPAVRRTSDLSYSEQTDVCCSVMLDISPLRVQKAGTQDELDAKLTRRVQRAARRQAKQEELKRLHRAQIIQRQLEQVEMKQKQLEEKGIAVEKALRGEADYWEDSSASDVLDIHLGGMGKKDDPSLMHQWFKLVQEKNALVRYESELMIFARELELEDRQSHLQQELRERMAVDDHLKDEEELTEERRILGEMLDVVEQRDSLVGLLEEQRLKEREEDSDLEAAMLSKGFSLNWA